MFYREKNRPLSLNTYENLVTALSIAFPISTVYVNAVN